MRDSNTTKKVMRAISFTISLRCGISLYKKIKMRRLIVVELIYNISSICCLGLPVQSNTQHSILSESCEEEVTVFSIISKLWQGTFCQSSHANPESNALKTRYCWVSYSYLHLFLRAIVSLQLYPPLRPAPSARISSSSGVAPPVISDLRHSRYNTVKQYWQPSTAPFLTV